MSISSILHNRDYTLTHIRVIIFNIHTHINV